MLKLKRIFLLPVALLALTAGCEDRNGPAGLSSDCGPLGPSSGTITGAVSADVNGCSIFTVSTSGTATTTISLNHGSGLPVSHAVALVRQGSRPAPGTYSVGTAAGNFTGTFTFNGGSGSDRTFALTAGTVTITGSSESTLAGSLSGVTAAETSTPANTVTINASFSARCIVTSSTGC
jgi:hypothetical protein